MSSCHRARQAGMTLIEVMIAVLLFGILSVGIFIALRVGINAMDRANDRLMANRRAAYAVRILESQLNGFMPESAVVPLTPQSPVQIMPFFQGEPASMRFVSTYSLQDASRGMPADPRIPRHPGRRQTRRPPGRQRASLYRAPSAGALCLGYHVDPATEHPHPAFRPDPDRAGSFVLADKLAYCRFLFETSASRPTSRRLGQPLGPRRVAARHPHRDGAARSRPRPPAAHDRNLRGTRQQNPGS